MPSSYNRHFTVMSPSCSLDATLSVVAALLDGVKEGLGGKFPKGTSACVLSKSAIVDLTVKIRSSPMSQMLLHKHARTIRFLLPVKVTPEDLHTESGEETPVEGDAGAVAGPKKNKKKRKDKDDAGGKKKKKKNKGKDDAGGKKKKKKNKGKDDAGGKKKKRQKEEVKEANQSAGLYTGVNRDASASGAKKPGKYAKVM